MTFGRVYTGNDGQSHFEEVDLLPANVERSVPQGNASISFMRSIDSQSTDWHVAPRRKYAIFLSGGQMEVGFGDSTALRFGPGDVVLFEDVTGQGHTTRNVGGDRLTVIVPLAE